MDSSGDVYERGVNDDSAEVIQSIDCYAPGSRTYEHALQLGWPYGDTPTVVMTDTRTALLSYRTGANQPTPSLKAVTPGSLITSASAASAAYSKSKKGSGAEKAKRLLTF